MRQFDVLRVVLDDGREDRWSELDGFGLEGGAFVVKKGGAVAGVYSLAHLVSAVIE